MSVNRGVTASIMSLVYRVEAITCNDLTWKTTCILLCSLVELDFAVIVSCTTGFAKFTRIHTPELRIVTSLCSGLGGNKSGQSSILNKMSWSRGKDPNRPRTGRGSKNWGDMYEDLGDTLVLNSVISTVKSVAPAQPPTTTGILRTVDVSQETRCPSFPPTTEVQQRQAQDYPSDPFYYGPGEARSSTQRPDGPSFVPYYRSISEVAGKYASHDSTKGGAVHSYQQV